MNRDECIRILQIAGGLIAEELKFTEMSIGEDRQKGIWGERLVEFLEKEYGECTKQIKWFDRDNPRNCVEFDFRFSSPRLTIRTLNKGDKNESLAALEYSDFKLDWTHYDELRKKPTHSWEEKKEEEMGHFYDCVHDGDFVCIEKQIWGQKGSEYEKMIENAVAKAEIMKNIEQEEEIER